MNRRSFLTMTAVGVGSAAVGGTAMWLAAGNGNTDPDAHTTESAENAPGAVQDSRPLAEAFHAHITEYYPDARLFIRNNGALMMEYSTDAGAGEELQSELHQIANEFASVVKEKDFAAKTFSAITSKVEAIAVESAVRAYVNGEINQNAYLETVEVMQVERENKRSD